MTQYIFIDIDGTLLDHSGQVPSSAVTAITEAQDKGHKVFINTGRSKSGMPEELLNLPFDGFVFSAGTVVEIADKQVFFDELTSDDVRLLSDLMVAQKIGFSLEGYNRSFYDDISHRVFQELNFLNDKPDKLLHFENYDQEHDQINKMCLFSDNSEVYTKLKAMLPEHLEIIIHDKNIYGIHLAEIIKNSINKATGVEKVIEHYEATREQTVCFGDSLNDYDMVKYCQIGVCMEDGSSELKAIADDIAKPAGEDGLYHYFKKIGLIQ